MKIVKRILVSLLAFTMVTGCFAGCGSNKKTGNENGGTSKTDIEIKVWNSGLGTDWLDAMIEGFKKVHPEYNVYYTASASEKAVTTSYGLADIDTTDLYLVTKMYDTTYMEPLNDLLNSTADGDTKPLIEKFDDAYLTLEKTSDGTIYSITYGGGVIGIVYSKELFKQAGIEQTPRTTNELAVVCNTLSSKGITPMTHFKLGGYWHFLEEDWYGQYEGVDNYLNFYQNPTKDLLAAKDGRYETLKAMEKFITPEYTLSGSNSSDHTTMQTKFLLGEAAMMVSGSWMANEMKATEGALDNFVTMKLPVLSSITNKLTTVKKESELRKVITAIDAYTDGGADITTYQKGADYEVDGITVSAADWEYLYAARNTVSQNYAGHGAFIPTYSNAKEGVKEFMKFMYSDAGYQIYLDSLHIELPMQLSSGEIDKSDWNQFELAQSDLLSICVQTFSAANRGKHALFSDGGAKLMAGVSHIDEFCSKNASDRMSADEIWDKIVKYVNNKYESTWLANIN